MKVTFTEQGWAEYLSWTVEPKMLRRINRLIGEAARDPLVGIGKPERLRNDLVGKFSRRITDEHRLVYEIADDALLIYQVRFYYL